MNIEIINIIDRGIANKERLWLRVIADCDLVYYMVYDTVYQSPSQISITPKHTYWFRAKKVKAGDYLILFTGKGNASESKNNDGSSNHFLYWNLDKTIWNKEGDCAVLFELSSWQTSKFE
jgi:hypothetical protein